MADDDEDRGIGPGDDPAVPPPPEVTPDLFRQWRAPREGHANPERMNNPVWEWLIRSRLSGYAATRTFENAAPFDNSPCWSFDRFGQSATTLPDGRIVRIGGEHEDSYDPDFFIYNDVTVEHPGGGLDIFGYPRAVFAPTDFHSATLVGGRIVIAGAFGYPDQRQPRMTPVYVLDTDTFAIARKECIGEAPGWLHRHSATYDVADNAIVMTRGLIDTGDDERNLVENIDDWKLHLGNWRWERLTRRQWPRWDIRREDMSMNALFDLRSLAYWNQVGESRFADETLERIREELGIEPDLGLLDALYSPPVAHTPQPDREEDDAGVRRITVNGVTVRYNETMWSVRMTVEGDLPAATLAALTDDLLRKLAALEGKRYETIRL